MSDPLVVVLGSGSAGAGLGYASVSELVKRVRRMLDDEPVEGYSATAITAQAISVSVSVDDPTVWSVGDVLEFASGERCKVRTIPTAGGVNINPLTVKRGHDDTTIEAHYINDVFYKNPTYPYFLIKEGLDRAIVDMWPYVWKKLEFGVTPSTTTHWFNLDDQCFGLITVSQLISNTTPQQLFFYGSDYGDRGTVLKNFPQSVSWRQGSGYPVGLKRNLPTSLCASGTGVYIPSKRDTTNQIYVAAQAKITNNVTSDTYEDIQDGMMADYVVNAAIERILLSRDIVRTVGQDAAQGDQSVRPGTRTQIAAYYNSKSKSLLNLLALECRERLPLMKTYGR